jgi:hypothetical protein
MTNRCWASVSVLGPSGGVSGGVSSGVFMGWYRCLRWWFEHCTAAGMRRSVRSGAIA